jgi:ubiquitin-conjugating enzyme E2 S
MKLVLTEGFPQSPPKGELFFNSSTLELSLTVLHLSLSSGYFLTKIYHPNISANGDICVNTLKRDWNADVGITHVLQVIRCLLIVPFPESSLNDEAGKLFMDSYDEYAQRARLMTSVHAMKSATKSDQENDASIQAGGDGPGTPKGVLKEQQKKKMKKKKSLKRL